ncbi:hypothetical protein SUGI_1089730 [Cryptomeria japonica]|uniref:UPF0481 protein At3g47200 n=1 Tax=Cryptomeria japonica TaxID=3369 RepID=UPI00241488F4|nr:UPF0481 protein At3g47200 [Cryptomeria japonica]XP_057869111.2 UPF0481 protein At3g47200 [Cryptomeria japonica]GLJ51221.1 hypothetical protein SUGI_1089730 [Cryptomeria japonica]
MQRGVSTPVKQERKSEAAKRNSRIAAKAKAPIMAGDKTMSDKESESVWLEEVRHRFNEGAWTRTARKETSRTISIHRIPTYFKDLNAKAYIPRVVSLGLFHHQPTRALSAMDRRKVDAALRMRQRLQPSKQTSLVDLFKKSIPEITSCYEGGMDTGDETIAWTCLLDGCFVLEILRVLTRQEDKINRPPDNLTSPTQVEENSDPIYNKNRVRTCQFDILGDFFMMENQIPIKVLSSLLQLEMDSPQSAQKELYKMICEIVSIIHPFLPRGFPTAEKPDSFEEAGDLEKYKHILGLFHCFVTEEYLARRLEGKQKPDIKKNSSAICFPIKNYTSRQEEEQLKKQNGKKQSDKKIGDEQELNTFIKGSASELFDNGMKFKPYYGVPSKEKICFRQKTLSLPTVFITDTSEMIFRNLMAMEVCRPKSMKYVSYYILLMNTLIEGEKDVAVLRREGVIQSSMGTDDEVTDLFNELCKGLNLQDVQEDPFAKVKRDLNMWYNNQRWVKLKRFFIRHPRLLRNFYIFWAIALALGAAVPTLLPIVKKFVDNQINS